MTCIWNDDGGRTSQTGFHKLNCSSICRTLRADLITVFGE